MHEPVWLSSALASTLASVDASESTTSEPTRDALEWEPSYVAPIAELSDVPTESAASTAASTAPGMASTTALTTTPTTTPTTTIEQQLTTVRSALLALEVDLAATGHATAVSAHIDVGAPTTTATTATMMMRSPSPAQSAAMAMTMPMIGELATIGDGVGVAHAGGAVMPGVSYAAPGMIADRAQAWSIAQERSASDLAFDFVTPELVLAARVYGLGPAEAAQAARLAIAGPGGLATMASTVDRAFVQAFAVEAERRAQAVTAYPRTDATSLPSGISLSSSSSSALSSPSASMASSSSASMASSSPSLPVAGQLPTRAFGVDRRPPRGAFMWPPATVAALGLMAASPDGEQSMSVAALELLAAQAVAELGTYAAFAPERAERAERAEHGERAERAERTDHIDATSSTVAGAAATTAQTSSSMSPEAAIRSSAPSDSEVLVAAAAMVPTSRRSKLEAMYVALGQSHSARSWSPAARAARALALAGRGDESITAYERASIAWDVLPVVAPSFVVGGDASPMSASYDELAPGATRSTGSANARARAAAAQQPHSQSQSQPVILPEYRESRPGLAGLSARAGEAIGSYVAPSLGQTSSPSSPSSSSSGGSSRDAGAMRRVPTAAQEMVRTGRPSGRFGGGEVEIPSWFESAARKMFDDRSSGGPASELSLAELTLITAAPANQVAASSRSQPSAVPGTPNPSSQGEQANKHSPIDTEKVANDVYRKVLVMMDAARARNGEPSL
jgi:hypothetical protein